MDPATEITQALGVPELNELGKHIEMLRIARGISKQHLARFASTSRQQLWRVMTGKSELTGPLRSRLAQVLAVDGSELGASAAIVATRAMRQSAAAETVAAPASVAEYLTDSSCVAATLRTIPNCDHGRQIKRRLLDHLEDHAIASGHALGSDFFDLRRRVVAGEL